ncbi:pyrophosphate-energized membrane proton pump 2 isoform X1 [Tanacetum coccineum]|uniref:H(+)-exporting diphosphatase n=1 Tax=Tanacetum coccineum TaxID=301880 RepID=A0ABQ5ERI5_9ASTR
MQAFILLCAPARLRLWVYAVGDNVGDCAARGADLFESIAAEIISAMILGGTMAHRCKIEDPSGFILFPLVIHSFDLIVSSVGIFSIRGTRDPGVIGVMEDPMTILQIWNISIDTVDAVHRTSSICLVELCSMRFGGNHDSLPFRLDYSAMGSNIIALGISLGLESTALPVIVISIAIVSAFWLGQTSGLVDEAGNPTGGLFGTAVATMGMLSTAAYVLTMDMFGPIAGGIVEMSQQPESVREITDVLDAAGNTTKATTKGFAIGSAALASFLLFSAYMDEVDIAIPEVFVGGLLGSMLIFLFSAWACAAVGRTAQEVVNEVRRQFIERTGIMDYYGRYVAIVASAYLREMIKPGALAVLSPIFIGRCLKEKHSGSNFNDWFCLPKLVLRVEKKLSVIEQPIPPAPPANSIAQVLTQWNAVYDAHNEVACLMLGKERKSVSSYVLKMKGYVEQLECLGYVLPQDLSVGIIMNGLTSDFAGFLSNYNMHNMGKTIGELHALFIEYEKGLLKKAATPQVMAIQGGRIQKANKKSLKGKVKGKGKVKDKHGYIPKGNNPKPYAKENLTKDDVCHHCKEVGHWKRNYLAYLAELIKKKKQVGTASSSCIFTIELFSFPNKSCVYDTGCGTHICNTKHGLRGVRKLKQGALYLYVGNGIRTQVEAIRIENQLEKTIKALRSDQGGEYISQEFKDYLKACGIVQQLTRPYTPQHNGVSERRNRTLLDMVMNLTTLSLFFWDYALESAINNA